MADTTTSHGRLILTVLGGLAELERELTVQRTQEGPNRAKREGRRLGRPPKLSAHQKALVTKWRSEGRDNADIARNISSGSAFLKTGCHLSRKNRRRFPRPPRN
ncbi:recombinase family protein [Celeribacter sp.]|uniref:recombinase family protein n=1 Tax=Celeribacter sp. TaxID=1890673 RepID=UPI003A8F4B64